MLAESACTVRVGARVRDGHRTCVLVPSLLLALCMSSDAFAQGVFQRGDCNQTLDTDIADPIYLLSFLFTGGDAPICEDACDANDSGGLDLSDVVYLLSYQFLGGDPPPSPYPEESVDPTDEDSLTCLNGQLAFEEIRVTPNPLVLQRLGETMTLTVLGFGEEVGLVDVRRHPSTSYSSDAPGVVSVSDEAVVTARGVGTATIGVRHRGVTGSASVTVAAGADGRPVVKITSPPSGAVVFAAAVRVSGIVTDPDAELTLRLGASKPRELMNGGGRFSSRVSLEVGENAITVAATANGLTGLVSIRVHRVAPGDADAVGPDGGRLPEIRAPRVVAPDVTAPVVQIMSPTSGEVLRSATISVVGAVDDPEAEVRVNGLLANVVAGAFVVDGLQLVGGANTITARAVDQVGNAAVDVVAVAVDDIYPRIEILDPRPAREGSDVLVSSMGAFELRGRVTGGVSGVTVNGRAALLTGEIFRADLDLGDGVHDLLVTAWGPEGLPGRSAAMGQGVYTLLVDTTAPSIEILHPPPSPFGSEADFFTGEESVRVVGRLRDPGTPLDLAETIQLRVNGGAPLAVQESFVVDLGLRPGENTFRLRARDVRGHSSSVILRIQRESTSGSHLVIDTGDRQSTVVGEDYPAQLAVRATTAVGSPRQSSGIEFRFLVGSGSFEGVGRRTVVSTDSDGVARVRVRAGDEIGARSQVIGVGIPGDPASSKAVVLDTTASGESQLVAHRGRRRVGVAGESTLDPLSVRVVDRRGDPVAGRTVLFRVVEGAARLGARASVALDVRTDSRGLAVVPVALPRGASRSRVEASFAGDLVSFEIDGIETGAPLDTAVKGWVGDDRGVGVAGATVRVAGADGVETTTGLRGQFVLHGAPVGRVRIEVDASATHSGTSRTVLLVSGRRHSLRGALRVVRLTDTSRTRVLRVSSSQGGVFSLTALAGLRLHVEPGSAIFSDGSHDGLVRVSAPSSRIVSGSSLDDIDVRIPIVISPSGVRFDPPARLVLPNPGFPACRTVPLHELDGNLGPRPMSPGRVSRDGLTIETSYGEGVRRGGLHFFELPGTSGGEVGRFDGDVDGGLARIVEVPQRTRSHVAGYNVYTHSGEFFLDAVDMEIRGRGLSFELRRRYESRSNFQGSLGWGWEHEYADRRVVRSPGSGNVVRVDGRGSRHEYLYDMGTERFASPIGIFSRLYEDTEGFLVEFQPDGLRYRYLPIDDSGAAGRLRSIRDRAGNRLLMERDDGGRLTAVVDTLGRRIEYAWDASGRIESVTDFTGRTVVFEYDDRGDLVAVTGPAVTGTPNGNDFPSGKRTEYRYTSGFDDRRLNHNLEAWIEPREVAAGTKIARLVNRYSENPGAAELDRVISQEIGGVNATGVVAGGAVEFEYIDRSFYAVGEPVPPGGLGAFLASEAVLTRVVDARGVTTEITSNGAGLPLVVRVYTLEDDRPRDANTLHPPAGVKPPWYETRFRWTREGLLRTEQSPRGGRTERVYDEEAPLRTSRANCVREELHAAPASSGATARPQVTLRVYEPVFGEVILETPPGSDGAPDESRATRRVLDYQENASIEALAASIGLDGAELLEALDHAGVPTGLGDQNDDGSVLHRLGRVVREDLPSTSGSDGVLRSSTRRFTYNFFGQLSTRRDAVGVVTRYGYHPERDPDGDGTATVGEGLDRDTGGFLAARIIDSDELGDDEPLGIRDSWAYDALGHLALHTDPVGNVSTYTHNQLGQLQEQRVAEPLAYRRQLTWDADNLLSATRYSNRRANDAGTHLFVSENPWIETSYEHDILGQLVSTTREVSGGEAGPERSVTTSLRRDPDGRIVRMIRPVAGTDETRQYDERGLEIVHVVAPGTTDEKRRDVYRDENGNILVEVDAADSDGDGERERTEMRYDGHDRLAVIIDAAGGARVFERDGTGKVFMESFLGTVGGPTPPDSGTDENVLLSRIVTVWDEQGRERERRRSLFGVAEEGGGPRTVVETRHHDAEGRLVLYIDPDGVERTFVRDAAGRIVKESDTAGNVIRRRFDATGNLVREERESVSRSVVDPSVVDDPDYDQNGRLRIVETDVHVYDPLGRRVLSVDSSGGTWRVRYDSSNNPVMISDSSATAIGAAAEPDLDDSLHLLTPDQRDNITGHGNRRRFTYDGLGHVVRAVHELRADGTGDSPIESTNGFNIDGLVTEIYEWDGNGRLGAWIDDLGHRTRVEWDRAGYLERKIRHDGTVELWEVDRDGSPTRHVDFDGVVTTLQFDSLHRLVERAISSGGEVAEVIGTTLQRFEYDGLGRLTLAWDNNEAGDTTDDALVLRRHDSLGRMITEWQGGFGYSYSHDDNGRLVSERYPDGRVVVRVRGPGGAQSALRDISGMAYVEYSRMSDGRILDRVVEGGTFSTFVGVDPAGIVRPVGYDELGGITATSHETAAGDVLARFQYGLNGRGDPLWQRRVDRDGVGDVWRYDSLYRIREYQPAVFDPRVPPQNPIRKHGFLLDGNHNWRQVEIDQSVLSVTVDALDRYENFGSQALEHGATGRIERLGADRFFYDALDRLIRIERAGSVVARYRYDAVGAQDPWRGRGRGRRVEKDVLVPSRDQRPGVLRYTWAHDGVGEERESSGGVLRQYLWEDGARPAVVMGRSSEESSLPRFFLHDARGSTLVLVRGDGSRRMSAEYGPHGQLRVRNGNGAVVAVPDSGSALFFGGQLWDFESGLHCRGARYFSPELGRFLTRQDGLRPTAPFELNGYNRPGLAGLPGAVAGSRKRTLDEGFLAPLTVTLEVRSTPATWPRGVAPEARDVGVAGGKR